MHFPFLRVAAAVVAFALTAVPTASMAQSSQPAKPTAKPVRNIPYVSITGDDGRQRHYETNAIPLLFNRACFGWRMYIGGPNRTVALTQGLTTSQPAEQGIAAPETAGSRAKNPAPTRMPEVVPDAVAHRSSRNIPRRP